MKGGNRCDALLVLGGECTLRRPRTRLAGQLYRLLCQQPGTAVPYIVLSGGKLEPETGQTEALGMWHFLVHLGVPSRCIGLETTAKNTYENILLGAQMAHRLGHTHIALVTDDFHLPRCRWLYQRVFPDLPAPASFASGFKGDASHWMHELISAAWWSSKLFFMNGVQR